MTSDTIDHLIRSLFGIFKNAECVKETRFAGVSAYYNALAESGFHADLIAQEIKAWIATESTFPYPCDILARCRLTAG